MKESKIHMLIMICFVEIIVESCVFAASTGDHTIHITIPVISQIALDTDIQEALSETQMVTAYNDGYHIVTDTGVLTVSHNRPWEVSVSSPGSFEDGNTNLDLSDFSIRVINASDGNADVVAQQHNESTSFVDPSTSITLVKDQNNGTHGSTIGIEYKISNIDETIKEGGVSFNVVYTISTYAA